MRFNIKWSIDYGRPHRNYTKPSDAYNNNIFLVDNLNNIYSHIYTGGCAAQDTMINAPGGTGDCNGWFQFPPAKLNATSFQFIDAANKVMIGDIILLPKQNK
jgi:hypothetical protein